MCGTVQGLTEISQVHHPKTFTFLAPLFARHQYIATISSHQLATAEQPQNFAGCLTNWLMLHFLTGSSTGLQTCWLHCHWTSKWLLSLNNAFPQSSHVQTLYFMAQWYCILFITIIRWFFFESPGYTTNLNEALTYGAWAYWDSCCFQIILQDITCLSLSSQISKASSLGVIFLLWPNLLSTWE